MIRSDKISKKFKTKEDCFRYMEKLKWNNNPTCPYCGCDHYYDNENRYRCANCLRPYSVITKTLFHHSRANWPEYFMLINEVLIMKITSIPKLNAKFGISHKSCWLGRKRIIPVIERYKSKHKVKPSFETLLKLMLKTV